MVERQADMGFGDQQVQWGESPDPHYSFVAAGSLWAGGVLGLLDTTCLYGLCAFWT